MLTVALEHKPEVLHKILIIMHTNMIGFVCAVRTLRQTTKHSNNPGQSESANSDAVAVVSNPANMNSARVVVVVVQESSCRHADGDTFAHAKAKCHNASAMQPPPMMRRNVATRTKLRKYSKMPTHRTPAQSCGHIVATDHPLILDFLFRLAKRARVTIT